MAEISRVLHRPVMLEEAIEALRVSPSGRYLDATLGSGGHAEAILRRLDEKGFLVGVDCDPEAVERSAARLRGFRAGVRILHGNFSMLRRLAAEAGISEFDGILFDLGVSTEQLAAAERGFSFQREGPLDMRMDLSTSLTAADLVNGLEETELERIIREFGEERFARRIARAITYRRRFAPIRTTMELARVVSSALGPARSRIHPATRTFQALRIAVNRELENIEEALEAALSLLRVGGRVAVISFHSLEDRIVKRTLARHAGRWESLAGGGRRLVFDHPRIALVARKPLRPSDEEVRINPLCRSAKLRAAQRIDEGGCDVQA